LSRAFRIVATVSLVLIASSLSLYAQEEDPPFGTSDTDVGYIDSAIPATQLRLRFDAAYDNPLPDRTEFFYRAARGPSAETRVDYQDITPYLEIATSNWTSWFVQAPVRFLNPDSLANTSGVGDLQLGVKQVLWSRPSDMLTFQLKTYAPTGDADQRLGTDHASLEPGLLYIERLSPRTTFEGELRLWVPINASETADGEDFAGEVLRYGIGFGHDFYRSYDCTNASRLSGVFEAVGWTIFDGFGTVLGPNQGAALHDVSGDTIVNAKLGLRWTDRRRSFYLGYGRGLTGDVWYRDIVRAEYSIRF